jgi:hypothetical protein
MPVPGRLAAPADDHYPSFFVHHEQPAARTAVSSANQRLDLNSATDRLGSGCDSQLFRFITAKQALKVRPPELTLACASIRPITDISQARSLARNTTVALTCGRGSLGCTAVLKFVVQVHYNASMKTAVIPQVRVEPELRADLDSVLLPGETLTEFVEASVRRAIEFRRVQTDFAARCDASLAEYERTGISIPSDVVLSKLKAKVAARVKQLRK